MERQAPTLGKLLTMAMFALSCFGLLLFLWLSFGGAIPLKPRGYRINVAFPQATQLAEQADVRTAGITVGKVVKKTIDSQHPNRTIATIELTQKFSPLHADARAILRQKTLLGETFIELTPGTKGTPTVRENGWLGDAQVQPNVYLDQVFQAFDPTTRQAFRNWQQDLAIGATGQGQNVNDALGNLPAFVADAGDVLNVLNSQSDAVRRLIRNTGVVFGALNRNTAQLRNVVTNSAQVFQTTSDTQNALAETFRIFPTFLDETKSTMSRLQSFATNTDPLVRDLRPVAHDLKPTLTDVRKFAPDLRRTFVNLDPLITASQTGLPALRDILNGANPLLAAVDPFLQQLNPILQFLELYQHQTADFISNGAAALAAVTPVQNTQNELGHYLRQFNPIGLESVAMFPQRPASDRGNAYLGPVALQGPEAAKNLIFPNTDCIPSGGEVSPLDVPLIGHPGCTVQSPIQFQGTAQKHVQIKPNDYSHP